MKPATPITNPAFRYTNAASTDIRATWARFGWKPKQDQRAPAQQKGKK